MDPRYRPDKVKTSPKPRFHTFRRAVFLEMWTAYSLVLGAFRDAAERLRDGDRDAVFPEGTFPPSLPFVSFAARGQPA